MLIFSSGFLGGFIIWAILPINTVPYSRIKLPYWLTMGFFLSLHKVEENIFKFQEKLAEITGTLVPEVTQPTLILLVVASVGAWLLIPAMLKRGYDFAYYLAWTFFFSDGNYRTGPLYFTVFQKSAVWLLSRYGQRSLFSPRCMVGNGATIYETQ